MPVFSENFKIIDNLNTQERYIIDYANIKQGIIKYQESFLNFSELNYFYKNIYTGIPLLLPTKCQSFFNFKNKFYLNKKFFSKKIFQKESFFSKKVFKYGSEFSDGGKLKETKIKLFKTIININIKTANVVQRLKKKGNTVGAFQTRNVPHFGHQKIIEEMLKKCDYLIINPVIGPKKIGDLDSTQLNKIFTFFSKNFYDQRLIYSPICANMFYGGPREACHHANLREKLGFDYFIVGRDHAGANGIYKYNEAVDAIKRNKKRFKINIICHYGSYYDTNKKIFIVNYKKELPSNYKDISGTEFRDHLRRKKFYNFADKLLQEYIFDTQ